MHRYMKNVYQILYKYDKSFRLFIRLLRQTFVTKLKMLHCYEMENSIAFAVSIEREVYSLHHRLNCVVYVCLPDCLLLCSFCCCSCVAFVVILGVCIIWNIVVLYGNVIKASEHKRTTANVCNICIVYMCAIDFVCTVCTLNDMCLYISITIRLADDRT